VGLGAFYCAQLGSPAFFGYLLAMIFLNLVTRRSDLDPIMAAISAGYRAGRRAEPLFGIAWDELWTEPIADLRARFGLDPERIVGEGILAAA